MVEDRASFSDGALHVQREEASGNLGVSLFGWIAVPSYPVLDIGRSYVDRKRQSQRVHQQMSFSALHVLASVVAAPMSLASVSAS